MSRDCNRTRIFRSRLVPTHDLFTTMPSPEPSSWMLLADLHFHKDNLDRNRETFSWVVSEFDKLRPTNVVILGDIVHTRGQIHLKTYHEIARLLRSMHDATWSPSIHILIGNHDMLDKHSRAINSMEIFDFASPRLVVYAETRETIIDGIRCIFLPYHEDQTVISEYLQSYSVTDRERIIVFAHASVEGAIVNGISDHSNLICKNSGGLTVSLLGSYRQTFLGHFHHHRTYGERRNVTYVGSPTQFNFGDAGDINRGFVVYSPSENQHTLKPSPHAEHFFRLAWNYAIAMGDSPPTDNQYAQKFLQIAIPASASADGTWNTDRESKIQNNLLTNWAVARVQFSRQAPVSLPRDEQEDRSVASAISSNQGREFIFAAIEDCLKSDLSANESVSAGRLEYIRGVIDEYHSKDTNSDDSRLFVAEIAKITMNNFMGVKGRLTINLESLEPGIWLVRGKNGTGKSTFLEAIAWGLFGETFRQCNAHDIVNMAADKSKQACEVTIQFMNGCVVKRSRKLGKPSLSFVRPHSTTGCMEERGVKSVGQAELDSLLNIGWKKFARSIMLSSSTTLNFTTSKEVEKRLVIEHLLGFEDFAAYTATTVTDMKQLLDQLGELLLEIARVEERTRSISYRIGDQEALKRGLEEESSTGDTMIAKLNEDLAEIEDEITTMDKAIAEKRNEREKWQNWLNDALDRQAVAQDTFTCKLNELDTLRCQMETKREEDHKHMRLRIGAIESEIRALRLSGSEAQAEIDNHFSTFMRKCDELSKKEFVALDRVVHQRKIDARAVHTQNLIDTKGILQTELEALERKMESDGLCRIERTATRIYDELKHKDVSGSLTPNLKSMEEGIIKPLRNLIRSTTTDDDLRKIKILEDMSSLSLSIAQGQRTLAELGPSDPHIDETYTKLRNRSRFFQDVDPEGFVAWDLARGEKARLDKTIEARENELHSLCSLSETQLIQGQVFEDYERADKELAAHRKHMITIKQDIDKVSQLLKSIDEDAPLIDVRQKKAAVEVHVKEIEAVNIQLRRQIEVATTTLDHIVQEKTKLQTELDALKTTQSKMELRRAVIGFWRDKLRCTKSNGFRAICIERKIHEINEEIERNMHILGDDGEGIFVDLGCKLNSSLSLVEKKGTIPFNRRSDGQKKRSSLALFFAILKKAKEGGGFLPKFMFMDEVYDALDEQGQLAVHRWIEHNTSEEMHEKTFVITHSNAVESIHRNRVKGVISAVWGCAGSSYSIENDEHLTNKAFMRL